jgi:putative Mn2+ efflux pump MntP
LVINFGAIFLLALGVAMDATAVAVVRGAMADTVRLHQVVMLALVFGAFQAAMPLLGWLIGARLGPSIIAWDHWIAFVLLVGIGARMIWESRSRGGGSASPLARGPFAPGLILVMALATSIDALALGVTLPILGAPLLLSIATIGITTAVLSALGVLAGRRFGGFLGRRLDALGGCVLIAMGVKILADHLRAG